MNPAMTQIELLDALEARQKELRSFFSSLPEEVFFNADSSRWNPAQHLIHLTRIGSRITQGLQARDQLLGHESASRGYEEVRQTYLAILKQAPPEMLAKVGASAQVEAGSSQTEIVSDYVLAGANLSEATRTWTESELDRKAMPHLALGSISVREMLEFVIYHDLHHLEGVRKTLA